MGIAKFTIPEELRPESPYDLVRRVGSGVVKALFNGQADDIVAKLEATELKGVTPSSLIGPHDLAFELWSGKYHIGDVYLRANGKSSDVVIDCFRTTQDYSNQFLQEYLK